eukprot:scaffold932_cov328-Pavlova_lutheri.AAC.38
MGLPFRTVSNLDDNGFDWKVNRDVDRKGIGFRRKGVDGRHVIEACPRAGGRHCHGRTRNVHGCMEPPSHAARRGRQPPPVADAASGATAKRPTVPTFENKLLRGWPSHAQVSVSFVHFRRVSTKRCVRRRSSDGN